ncbi:MAG: TRAP transporter TatT component family protein [Dissulfuribacterales bacterium]
MPVPMQYRCKTGFFNALLSEVIESSKDILPEAALSNAIAREKAKKLITQSDDFF